MIAINGGLTDIYGLYHATLIIHIVGLILISAIVLIKRENPFSKRHNWFLYLGGAIGVFTTISNNFSFGRISVSAILALMLFGQSVAGIAVDRYGLLGMAKHPFSKHKVFGLLLVLAGIVSMISDFEIIAVILSFAAGVCIVISRSLNAKLSEQSSVRVGTFFNYITGILVAIPVLLLLGGNEVPFSEFTFSGNWYLYLGGAFGVCIILLSNITVVKISAFYLTLLIFVGQVFSGIIVIYSNITRSITQNNIRRYSCNRRFVFGFGVGQNENPDTLQVAASQIFIHFHIEKKLRV
ncbi:MAG: DMT family transporter [Oscillospiraceae bacterium]|nr:DMT family transporter [Oscillospiraceae bacterium]